MKKALAILLVVLVSVSTLYAGLGDSYKGASKKEALAVGLNFGTNAGLAVNYGMGDFDLEGIVGLNILDGAIDVEAAANYKIMDLAKELDIDGKMPLTVGGEVALSANLNGAFKLSVAALVPVKVTYTFPKFPVNIYLRLAPGVGVQLVDSLNIGIDMQGSLGVTYNF